MNKLTEIAATNERNEFSSSFTRESCDNRIRLFSTLDSFRRDLIGPGKNNATGNPMIMSRTTKRIAQFGISKNGKTCAIPWIAPSHRRRRQPRPCKRCAASARRRSCRSSGFRPRFHSINFLHYRLETRLVAHAVVKPIALIHQNMGSRSS